MRITPRVFYAIAVLALAALACQAVMGGGEPVEPRSSTTGGKVILQDDFSSTRWGTGTDSDSAVEYVDGALNFIVFERDYFVWSTPDNETYEDIHMETTVINNGTDSTTAFGLICHKTAGNDFHYLVMTPAGQYAIALAREGERDLFLTNNDEWADSDLIAVNADSYRVGADCGNGRLTLYVDGQQIASVTDSTYTRGRVAVMVWSGEDAGITTNVSFDDFVMTELP
ncbi:MAG: hypothetical protein C3F07_09855 [Anaerolineales bacterium]|nr:hypothetical protein [Anaerolineae bacterium]PWB73403.1 MAG: hypothetical protein C3F07_09855 [Anaerolineales bacterium]